MIYMEPKKIFSCRRDEAKMAEEEESQRLDFIVEWIFKLIMGVRNIINKKDGYFLVLK